MNKYLILIAISPIIVFASLLLSGVIFFDICKEVACEILREF